MKTDTLLAASTFDGPNPEEITKIKAMGEKAMKDYLHALQLYFLVTNKIIK